MIRCAVRQILVQPWIERRQVGQPWLVWLLIGAALVLPIMAWASHGLDLAMALFALPVCLLVFMSWLMLAESALKQNTALNSRLVPGFRRRLARAVIVSYLAGSLAIGGAVALGFSSLIASETGGLGAFVALAALFLATTALSLSVRYFAWPAAVFLIGGLQFDSVRRAVGTVFSFSSHQQLLSALVVLTAGSVALAWAYSRPRSIEKKWTFEAWRMDAVNQQKSASGLYLWALRRAVERRNIHALIAHATGPGSHWTIVAMSIPLLLVVCGFLSFTNNPFFWALIVAMPLTLGSSSAEAVRQAVYVTRAEQTLVLLAPNTPLGRDLNRSLLATYTKTFAFELVTILVLTLPLVFLIGPAPYSKTVLATAAIVCSLPAALRLVTDYSRLKQPSAASIFPGILFGVIALVVLYFAHERSPDSVPAAALLIAALVYALFVARWRRAIRAPSFFPAGRLTPN